jgi:hypothetical protein
MDNKKNIPFQRDQMQKITDILGYPTSKYFFLVCGSYLKRHS